MNAEPIAPPSVRLVGVQPWLPWPLSAWPWWTEPVAAQRLAALRIGLALFLLIDILWTYLPNLDALFLDGGPGGSRIFGWYTQAPRWTWSILRGLGDPLIYTMILLGWLVAFFGVLFAGITRSAAGDGSNWRWRLAWLLAGVALVGSSWGRAWQAPPNTPAFWFMPAAMAATTLLSVLIELVQWLRGRASRPALAWAAIALAVFAGLLALGWWIDREEVEIVGLTWLLRPWQSDSTLLLVAGLAWALATALLIVGWQTRGAAIVTWVLSTSFANLNPNIDNAGDVIRGIILFYLMLCPCGAVWSVDRLWQRRRQSAPESIVISPWPLRLLFIQLVFIYCMNGLYKLGGDDWLQGDSLHYVLCDVTLTRFSYAQFPLPLWLTQVSTWAVLTWEVGFPLWVSLPWTRKAALWFGVLFHVGIYVSMELGNFVPYVLTLYLPLLPWERFGRLRFRSR